MTAQRNPASWVIRHKDTGEVIMETWSRDLVSRLNPAFEAVPIMDYLAAFNKEAARHA